MPQVTSVRPGLRLTVLGTGYLGLAHAVTLLAEILGADPRIGGSYMVPGGGFGGACLPKDIRAFVTRAAELGAAEALNFLTEIDAINLRCRNRMIDLVKKVLGGSVTGQAISILGLSFKADSDDIRDSPALAPAKAVHKLGANVTVYDPVAMLKVRKECPGLVYAGSVIGAAHKSDVILLLTEWLEFGEAGPEILGKAVALRNMVDGRNAPDSRPWRSADWDFYALGRPSLTSVS